MKNENYGPGTKEYRKLSRRLNFLKHQLKLSNKQISDIIDCTILEISDTFVHGKKSLSYEKLSNLIDILETTNKNTNNTKFDYEKLSLERDKKIIEDIKKYISKNNMLMKEFQKKSNISPASFSRFISGEMRFSRKSLDDCINICKAIDKTIEDYIIMDNVMEIDNIISSNFSDLVKEVANKRNVTKSSFIEKHHMDLYYYRMNPIGSQSLYKTEIVQNALHFDFLHAKYFEDESSSKQNKKPEFGVEFTCKCGALSSTDWGSITCALCKTKNTFLGGEDVSNELFGTLKFGSKPDELEDPVSRFINEDSARQAQIVNRRDRCLVQEGPLFDDDDHITIKSKEDADRCLACKDKGCIDNSEAHSVHDMSQSPKRIDECVYEHNKLKGIMSNIGIKVNSIAPDEQVLDIQLDYALYKKIKPLQDIINICKENDIKLNYEISVNAKI